MKKIILFAAILFSAVSLVNAQGKSDYGHSQGDNGNGGAVNSSSETVNLTVNLHAVQSITVGGPVVIDYKSAADYANGASSAVQKNHLSVVSAGGFVIRVSAPNLTNDGSDVIEASSIKVIAKASEKTEGVVANDAGVSLNDATSTLISSTKGGVNKTFDVTYTGDSNNAYVNNYNAEGSQSYTTTVTYTIAAS